MRLLVALFVAIAAALSASPARANTVYTFEASCSDCTGPSGTPLVTATLVLAGETPGKDFSVSDFVSFSYDGSDKAPAFTILPGGLFASFFYATFLDEPSQFANVSIWGQAKDDPRAWAFATDASGNFNLAVSGGGGGGNGGVDQGTDATWTNAATVPEAPSFTLVAIGLLAAIVANRRRPAR